MVRVSYLLLCVSLAASSVFADDTVYLPARFADGGNSLLDQLEFKTDDPEFSASAFCQAIADKQGKLKKAKCMVTDRAHLAYKSQVENKLTGIAILAASINQQPVDVRMKLTVSYFCKKNNCRGLVSLNDGQSRERFGINYVSPQQIIENKDDSLFDVPRQYEPGIKYSIEITVDEQGNAGQIEVLHVNPNYKKWLRSLKRILPREKYIPGIYKAAYTKMPYYHFYWVDKASSATAEPITGNKMYMVK